MFRRIATWLSFLLVTTAVVHCRSPFDREDLGTPEQCLKNCAQCKQMFGVFFEGQRCAESCFQAAEQVILPDCNVPASVEKFLRSLFDARKYDYYQYHVQNHGSHMKRIGNRRDETKNRWFYLINSA